MDIKNTSGRGAPVFEIPVDEETMLMLLRRDDVKELREAIARSGRGAMQLLSRYWKEWLCDMTGEKDILEFIRVSRCEFADEEKMSFGIFCSSSAIHYQLVGIVSVHILTRGVGEIDFCIFDDISEESVDASLKALISWCMYWNFSRFTINCCDDDEHRQAVAKRIGFKLEATLQKAFYSKNSKIHQDVEVYTFIVSKDYVACIHSSDNTFDCPRNGKPGRCLFVSCPNYRPMS